MSLKRIDRMSPPLVEILTTNLSVITVIIFSGMFGNVVVSGFSIAVARVSGGAAFRTTFSVVSTELGFSFCGIVVS